MGFVSKEKGEERWEIGQVRSVIIRGKFSCACKRDGTVSEAISSRFIFSRLESVVLYVVEGQSSSHDLRNNLFLDFFFSIK